MHRTTTYTLFIIAPVKPRSVDTTARYMRRVEPESEFRFVFFLGAPQKTQQPPWLLLLAGSTAHFYSRHRTRVSLFRFPPSLPCLIALGIAFARCCIRRWPCFVCMYTLPGLPAGAPRPAEVNNPTWDKTKATRGALPGLLPFIHQLHQSGKTPQGARRYFSSRSSLLDSKMALHARHACAVLSLHANEERLL